MHPAGAMIADRSGRSPRPWRAWPLLLLALLGACAGDPAGWTPPGEGTSIAPATATPPPQDPLAAFAAGAAPGSEAVLPLPGGGTGRVRLERAYFAASGRECREVVIGTGMAERASVLCREGAAWIPSKPLIGGGAGARWMPRR